MKTLEIINGRVVRGIKKGLNIKGSHIEKQIIENISLYFGITFSRIQKFKNSDYNFAFLQPGDSYRQKFNMYNEILLLFSQFCDFDRRILDFVDKTLIDYDNRLDKVCIFLISKDRNIENKILDLNKENKDSKLIVPFTYDEFINGTVSQESIENKLRKYFYSRDLFALESPIQNDSYFFGRKKTVQEFYSKYVNGEQGGLFGLRKIGKTSLLYALKRTIKSKDGRCVFLDCQSPAIHSLRWHQLLRLILEKLMLEYNINIDLSTYNFDENNASKSFETVILHLYNLLGNKRILLIFDEIEMITIDTASSYHWKNEYDFVYFWQTIRAFCQEHQEELSFLVAGVNPHCVEVVSCKGIDNPIFSMISPIYLDLFEISEVKDMVSSIGKYMGLNFDEEIYTKLVDDYGGHPFLIRHICSLINKNVPIERPERVNKYDYETHKSSYDIGIIKHIEQIIQILKQWYPLEYKMLEILAVQGNDKFRNSIGRSDYTTIAHLTGYGILKKYKDKYYITIHALNQYLKNNTEIYLDDTMKQKRTAISERRNKLEIKIRDIILTLFIGKHGKKLAREKILNAKKSEERVNFEGIPLNILMEKQYFFPELKVIIEKNWEEFSNIFVDKSRFSTSMEIINSFRVDAHAKSITEDDYLMVNIALKRLEECVFG